MNALASDVCSVSVSRSRNMSWRVYLYVCPSTCLCPNTLRGREQEYEIEYALSTGTKINDLVWPWNDLTVIKHSIALHTCVSEPTTKICMKIDPYYQRQKYSPGIPVPSRVSVMRTFAGVRWRGGVKWECGGRKRRFSLLSSAISSEPSHLRPNLLYCTM